MEYEDFKKNFFSTHKIMVEKYFDVLKSIVKIKGNDSSASGFLVEKNGKKYLVTNKHVISKGKFDFCSNFEILEKIQISINVEIDSEISNQTFNVFLEKDKNLKIHKLNYVDIAIIDLNQLKELINKKISFIDSDNILTSSDFQKYGINYQSKVVISGYLEGQDFKNLPISFLNELDSPIIGGKVFEINSNNFNEMYIVHQNYFKILGLSGVGMSGSPIICLDYFINIEKPFVIMGIASIFSVERKYAHCNISSLIIALLNEFN